MKRAADPPEDARSNLWFTYHLGWKLKKLYANSRKDRDWAIRNLLWDYEPEPSDVARWRIRDEPSAYKVLKEINGYTWGDKKPAVHVRRPQGRRIDGLRSMDLYRCHTRRRQEQCSTPPVRQLDLARLGLHLACQSSYHV
ncbi:MAG: hypothetical protein MZW92_71425 [Comamonadaceae bacterium]|nr:hypothetical protein [Comamonadaceae bacterium]